MFAKARLREAAAGDGGQAAGDGLREGLRSQQQEEGESGGGAEGTTEGGEAEGAHADGAGEGSESDDDVVE